MPPKIILNLSTTDYGGAGKFALNFNKLLLESGYDAYLVVRSSRTPHPRTVEYPEKKTQGIVARWQRHWAKKSFSESDFDKDRYFYGLHERYATVSAKTILSLLPQLPAAIFIHWVPNFVNAKVVNELHQLSGAKIIWVMVDNAPLTGGCHFSWECQHYASTCYDCPAILTPAKKWLAEENLAYKKRHLTINATICVFSQNDFERAEKSALFGQKKIIKFPGYFVDERKFRPGDKAAAKAAFSIPAEKRVVFFGATFLDEKRKGMQLFVEALQNVENVNTTLLVAGDASQLPTGLPDMQLVGNLDEAQLILAYQAADMFVCPTLEDSGPTMTNQAIMCGTPVVSFDTGLGRDLVHTGQTGYRARYGDSLDLARGINFLLNQSPKEARCISRNCRDLAIETYGGVEAYKKRLVSIIDHEATA